LIYAEVSDLHVDLFTGKDGKERVSLKGVVQEVWLTAKTDKPAAEKPEKQLKHPLDEVDSDVPF
jgi:hypothetical protein